MPRDILYLDKSAPYLITIQRGLLTLRWTTWPETIISDGRTFEPGAGAAVSNLSYYGDGSVADNCDCMIAGTSDGPVYPGDGRSGVLDNWPITIEIIDPAAPSDGATIVLVGSVGSTTEDGDNLITIAANSSLRMMQEKPLCEHYSLLGREILGDDRCKIPLLASPAIDAFDVQRNQAYNTKDGAPDVNVDLTTFFNTGLLTVASAWARVRKGSAGTVEDYANLILECTTLGTTAATSPDYSGITEGTTVTDGTAVFTARNAWTRYARGQAIDSFNVQLTALPDPRASDPAWYKLGTLLVRSGPLAGFRQMIIRGWDPGSLTVNLFLPVDTATIAADTELEISPGCDQTPAMCFSKFDNIVNIRAEPFVPPSNYTMSLAGQ
jgi:hypothetical protein